MGLWPDDGLTLRPWLCSVEAHPASRPVTGARDAPRVRRGQPRGDILFKTNEKSKNKEG